MIANTQTLPRIPTSLEAKLRDSRKQDDPGGKYHTQNIASVEASYLMALRMARAMGPHAFAEDFPLPAARDVRVMIRNMTLNQTKES